MAQPVKKVIKAVNKIKKTKKQTKTVKKHKEYGTSKLEEKFAKEFLDKLGVKYVYQYKAESIGRYFDFYLPEVRLIIECDGGYFHSDPRVIGDKELNPMQKKNKRVDEQKNKWALLNGIPILRIWEKDINENPSMVMKILKEKIGSCSEKIKLEENKKKRH